MYGTVAVGCISRFSLGKVWRRGIDKCLCVNLYTIYRYNMQRKKEKSKLKIRNKRQRKGIGSSVLCLRCWKCFFLLNFLMLFVCVWFLFVCVCACRVKDQIRSAPKKSITTSTTTIRVKTWVCVCSVSACWRFQSLGKSTLNQLVFHFCTSWTNRGVNTERERPQPCCVS